MMPCARYRSAEVRCVYFRGGFVVRHDEYPHTTVQDGTQVTRQGHEIRVGARQGRATDPDAGLAVTRYTRPDTDPAFIPPHFDPWGDR